MFIELNPTRKMQDEKTKNSARGDVSYLQSQQLRK